MFFDYVLSIHKILDGRVVYPGVTVLNFVIHEDIGCKPAN